ncbi:MAG: hypothetical protein FJ247_13970 [Nitrospira sp.]|nr:hypothetical protein [Nitrospira sp.]
MPRKPSEKSGHPKALKIESSKLHSSNEMSRQESTPSPKDRPSSSQSEPQRLERLIVMFLPRRQT